jgi:hypothetical protein
MAGPGFEQGVSEQRKGKKGETWVREPTLGPWGLHYFLWHLEEDSSLRFPGA